VSVNRVPVSFHYYSIALEFGTSKYECVFNRTGQLPGFSIRTPARAFGDSRVYLPAPPALHDALWRPCFGLSPRMRLTTVSVGFSESWFGGLAHRPRRTMSSSRLC
jgi:hypothetical protein